MSFKEVTVNWLEEVIAPAVDAFYNEQRDRDLIERNAGERAIVAVIYCTAKTILLELQGQKPELDGLVIDLEYDRNDKEPKWVFQKCEQCKKTGCFNLTNERPRLSRRSIPDLIIHQRGSNENNQVVIEFKKVGFGNPKGRGVDTAKLVYFTCQQPFPGHEDKNYQFHIGFFIDLGRKGYSVTTFEDATKGLRRRRQEGEWK